MYQISSLLTLIASDYRDFDDNNNTNCPAKVQYLWLGAFHVMSRHTTDRLISRVLYASITDIYCGIKIIESSACRSAGTRGQANQPLINRSIDLWCLTELPDNGGASTTKDVFTNHWRERVTFIGNRFRNTMFQSLFALVMSRWCCRWWGGKEFVGVFHFLLCGFIECNWRDEYWFLVVAVNH